MNLFPRNVWEIRILLSLVHIKRLLLIYLGTKMFMAKFSKFILKLIFSSDNLNA